MVAGDVLLVSESLATPNARRLVEPGAIDSELSITVVFAIKTPGQSRSLWLPIAFCLGLLCMRWA